MDWLYTSAPCLRNLTASELSGAIQRYGALVIDKDVSDQDIQLKLYKFYDETVSEVLKESPFEERKL